MNPDWWHWMVLGLALGLAELAMPSFVLIWFGLGALAGRRWCRWPLPGMSAWRRNWRSGWWTIASALARPRRTPGMSSGGPIGEIGLLVQDVAPFGRGRVRFQKPVLGSDAWDCIADEELAAGERVKVLSVEGTLLKVGRINKGVSA
jgi:membrane protein implicated in regulation of membrane protease activity